MSQRKRQLPRTLRHPFPGEEISTVTPDGCSVWTTPQAKARGAEYFAVRGVRIGLDETPEGLVCAACYLEDEVDRRLRAIGAGGSTGLASHEPELMPHELQYLDAVLAGRRELAATLFGMTRWELGARRALREGRRLFETGQRMLNADIKRF